MNATLTTAIWVVAGFLLAALMVVKIYLARRRRRRRLELGEHVDIDVSQDSSSDFFDYINQGDGGGFVDSGGGGFDGSGGCDGGHGGH